MKHTFTDEQLKVLLTLDQEMKNCRFLGGELRDLSYWLDNGYKEGEAKTLAVDLIEAEHQRVLAQGQTLFDELMSKRQEYEALNKVK